MLNNLYKQLEEAPQDKSKPLRYYKTSPGSYAAHDVFVGISVPQLRQISKQHLTLTHSDLSMLIRSKINEYRFMALLILIHQSKIDDDNQHKCYDFYLQHIDHINNWNLVDLSSHEIIGRFLVNKPHDILHSLVLSDHMWHRRIAIVSTWRFIRLDKFDTSLDLVTQLLGDRHDLIHKACGWMLREIGKRDESLMRNYINQHISLMPRTTLRYAIERLTAAQKLHYMSLS